MKIVKKIFDFLRSLLGAILIAVIIKEFFFDLQFIPTGSMIPNLMIGDRIVADRMVFGVQNPLYSAKMKKSIMLLLPNPLYKWESVFSKDKYFYQRDFEIKRYDILVFFPPENPVPAEVYYYRNEEKSEPIYFYDPPMSGERYVKRVLGLPGETIQLIAGYVYVNGKKLEEPFPVNRDYLDFGPFEIPLGTYFMIGDNRPQSADSRYWGVVPEENLLGKAVFTFWPLDRAKTIKNGTDYER